jgi:hypothetical protein
MSKIGRNEACPCGSGKKYKKFHGDIASPSPAVFDPSEINRMLDQQRAREQIRETQQGRGRPIIGFKQGERQVVAVGNTVYFSNKWKTFPDFLAEYIKQELDPAWGNAFIRKFSSPRRCPWDSKRPNRDDRLLAAIVAALVF